jgi:hypothetical protein
MDVAQTPFLELTDGPFSGSAELGRISQTRTVVVGEVVQGLHDGGRTTAAAAATTTAAETTATAEFRGLDFVNYIQVDPLNRLLGDEQRGHEQKEHCEDN